VTLEDKVHAFRLRLFRRAEELGNISAACREAGISRSLYYQLRERFERYGSDGLHPKHRQGRPGRLEGLLILGWESRYTFAAISKPEEN
jgi:transposase